MDSGADNRSGNWGRDRRPRRLRPLLSPSHPSEDRRRGSNSSSQDPRGTSQSLDSFIGKPIVLGRVAKWCSNCVEGTEIFSQPEHSLYRFARVTALEMGSYNALGAPGPGHRNLGGPERVQRASRVAPRGEFFLRGKPALSEGRPRAPRRHPSVGKQRCPGTSLTGSFGSTHSAAERPEGTGEGGNRSFSRSGRAGGGLRRDPTSWLLPN